MKYAMTVVALALIVLAGCQTTDMGEKSMASKSMMDYQFTVKVEVLSGSPTPIAPIAWAVHTGSNPLFSMDMGMRIQGLEALAEDGDPSGVAASLGMKEGVTASGVAAVPMGANGPGPAGPGSSYSFTFDAHSGQKLSFATMYVQSNDLFFSPGAEGLPLFDMGSPMHGDVTMYITLYDAGTEKNEQPGSGPNQAPRQMAPNTGMDEMAQVRPIAQVMDGYTYPAVDQVIKVTISSMM